MLMQHCALSGIVPRDSKLDADNKVPIYCGHRIASPVAPASEPGPSPMAVSKGKAFTQQKAPLKHLDHLNICAS